MHMGRATMLPMVLLLALIPKTVYRKKVSEIVNLTQFSLTGLAIWKELVMLYHLEDSLWSLK